MEVKTFIDINFGSVRSLLIDGEPFFVASDIASCLGYKNSYNIVMKNCGNIKKEKICIKDNMVRDVNCIDYDNVVRLANNCLSRRSGGFLEWFHSHIMPSFNEVGYGGPKNDAGDTLYKKLLEIQAAERDIVIEALNMKSDFELKMKRFDDANLKAKPDDSGVRESISTPSVLLKKLNVRVSVCDFYLALMNKGYVNFIKGRRRLTESGLKYGRNIVKNNSTRIMFFDDKFSSLIKEVGLK